MTNNFVFLENFSKYQSLYRKSRYYRRNSKTRMCFFINFSIMFRCITIVSIIISLVFASSLAWVTFHLFRCSINFQRHILWYPHSSYSQKFKIVFYIIFFMSIYRMRFSTHGLIIHTCLYLHSKFLILSVLRTNQL